jgi:hypothetical protein
MGALRRAEVGDAPLSALVANGQAAGRPEVTAAQAVVDALS